MTLFFSIVLLTRLTLSVHASYTYVSVPERPFLESVTTWTNGQYDLGPLPVQNLSAEEQRLYLELLEDFKGETPGRVCLALFSGFDSPSSTREFIYILSLDASSLQERDVYGNGTLRFTSNRSLCMSLVYDNGVLTAEYMTVSEHGSDWGLSIHASSDNSGIWYNPDHYDFSKNWPNARLFTEDTRFTFTGEPLPSYPVTVDYVYEDGMQAAPSVTREVLSGAAYEIPSPEVRGAAPDRETVMGTATAPAQEVVTYTRLRYSLRILYALPDGEQAAPDYTGEYLYREPYSVQSPSISGYVPQEASISGLMPDEALSRSVSYSVISDVEDPPGPSISGKVLEFGMFERLFNILRDSGGAAITMYIKASILVTALVSVVGIARSVILSLFSDRDGPPPNMPY